MIDSKVTSHDTFFTFLRILNVLTPCFSPLACVMLRTYEYTTLIYMANVFFSHCTVIQFPSAKRVNASLCASHTVRSSSLRTDRHTAVFVCAVNTCDTAVVLGLPLKMPLAVKFSCCEWIINSRTRISLKFLWSFCRHMTCV